MAIGVFVFGPLAAASEDGTPGRAVSARKDAAKPTGNGGSQNVSEVAANSAVAASGAAAAAEPAAALPNAAAGQARGQRAALNLLGGVDSSAGESRRNENVEITLVDNNVLKELNIRMGPTATIIRQFDIDKGYFGVEFGGSPARQIHLSERTATGIHGNLYETHTNSLFSARSFFQVGDVQPARENDYGFNVSFPLWSKAHLSIEGSQQRIRGSVNGNVLVPTPDERTPLATDPRLFELVSEILHAFPAEPPNRTDINPRALNTNAPQEIDNDAIGTRLDQPLGDSDRLSLSHRFKVQKVDAFQLVRGQNPDTTTRSHTTRLTWGRTWSSVTTSDFSVGFDRVTSLIVPDETSFGPLIWTGRQLQTLGGTSSLPFDRANNGFRYAGLLRHVRGGHLLTTGFEVARAQVNGIESSRHLGLLSFSSDFEDEFGQPRDTITNLRLGTPSTFLLGVGNTHRGFRDWHSQYFVGDRWQAGADLTLTYGLRYEPATRPTEVNGLSELPYSCDCNNFAPQFGFAYRLGSRAGVLRGAYGLHYGNIYVATYSQARFNPPRNLTLSVTAPDMRDPLSGVDPGALQPDARSNIFEFAPDLATPYSHHYNFSWELTPARNWTVRLGYLGSRAHRLLSTWFFNRAENVAGIPLETSTVHDRRPDQRYFEVRRILNGSRGYYDAAKVELIGRQWHGLTMELSYWFSKAIDLGAHYASNAGNFDSFRGRSQTALDVHGDVKGLSDFDQPHAALWRFSYHTPRVAAKNLLGRILGQWELFSVVLLKAGTPFEVLSGSDGPGFGNVDGLSGDRPHLLDPSILGGSVDHPDTAPLRLPRSAFAFIAPGEAAGNLGRNVFRKDGIRNVNFAVSRNWRLAAEKTLTFRAESINFFNTPQFAEPGMELTGENFGEITNTLNDGRSFRFLLRFSF